MNDGFNIAGNMNFGGVQVSGFQTVNGQVTASWGNHDLFAFNPQQTYVAHQPFVQPTHVYKQMSQYGVTQHQTTVTYLTEQRPVHVQKKKASPQQLSELKQVLIDRGLSKSKAQKMVKTLNKQFKYEPDKLTAQVWNTGFKSSNQQKMFEYARTELKDKGYTPVRADAEAQLLVKQFKTDTKSMKVAVDLYEATPAKKAKDELHKNFNWAVGEFQKLGYSPQQSRPYIIAAQKQNLHNPEAFKDWVRNAPPARPATPTPPPSQPTTVQTSQPTTQQTSQPTRRAAPEPPVDKTPKPVRQQESSAPDKPKVPPFPKTRPLDMSNEQYLREEVKPWAKQLFENQGRSPRMAEILADDLVAKMSGKMPDLSVVPVKPSELSIAESKKKDAEALDLLFLDSTATEQDVNRAFRKKAIRYHPDSSPNGTVNPDDAAMFHSLIAAKDHLLNSKTFKGASR